MQLITSPVRESQEFGLEPQDSGNYIGGIYNSTDRERGEPTTVNESTESDNARDGIVIHTIPQIEHTEHTTCLQTSIEVDVETSRQVAVAITNHHKLNNVR